MKSHFITGTGTGVGKTVLTAALAAAARGAGEDVAPMKPVQTGATCHGDLWRAPDLDFCLRAMGLEIDEEAYRDMAPCCFAPACSPHLAAREAGREIGLQPLLDAYTRLAERHATVLVEGAGGALVPLHDTITMLDLMRRLALPVLVAASPRLGTLNHTLLTLHALRSADLEVGGVVLIDTTGEPWGTIEDDNAGTIERLGATRVLGAIPYLGNLESSGSATPCLSEIGARILSRLSC